MVGGHSMTWKTCKQPWNEPVCLGCMSNRMVIGDPGHFKFATRKPCVKGAAGKGFMGLPGSLRTQGPSTCISCDSCLGT